MKSTNLKLLHKVLEGVGKAGEEGISSYNLSRGVGEPEQALRYHIDHFLDQGLLFKKGKKLKLTQEDTVFIKDGSAIIHDTRKGRDPITMEVQCPFFGGCKCGVEYPSECKLLAHPTIAAIPVVKRVIKVQQKWHNQPGLVENNNGK